MRAPSIVLLGLGMGVGAACARRFAEAKWSVMIVDGDHKNLSRAEDDLGDLCSYLHEDQYTTLGLKNALSGTIEHFDGVDIVLSIPPVPDPSNLKELTADQLEKLMKQSVVSTVLASRIFSNHMIERIAEEAESVERARYEKGFISILSRAALAYDQDNIAAGITQGAVLNTVRTLALELAPHKIRSNAIIAIRPRAEKTESWLKQRTPFGRSAKADEIADSALFLASPESRYMTGQALQLDGGRSLLNGMLKTVDV